MNNLNNIQEKYKVLHDVSADKKIKFKGKEQLLRDIILNMKIGQNNLFITTKQGNSKYSKDILVIVMPKHRLDART